MDEQLDDVIVQAIVEVALEGPGELRMRDVARMQGRVVDVHTWHGLLHLDHQLHGAVRLFARRKTHECVLISGQLLEDFFQIRHAPYCMMPERMSAFPEHIRVKLSSEAAGAISLSPVVVRDIPAHEFIECILPQSGKRIDRIQEILLRGSMVSGASRFRWAGWQASQSDIAGLLAQFPDPEPWRPFDQKLCVHAALCGPTARIELPREAASRKGFLRRTSFWDTLMRVAAAASPAYQEYSYKDRGDVYRAALSIEAASTLRREASRLTFSTLTRQIQSAALNAMEFHLPR